jgi:Tol biopolymer transport system component/tRNA A-37 threonylcarbamoyl transferase component Bud32
MGPDRDMRISPSGGGDIAGIQIGQYRLVAHLGSGGMGEVYRARDTKLDRDVAIKILPARVCRDQERRARFLREARLLATLNHPHIGSIYDLEDMGDESALVLEYIEGPTLAERLAQGPLSVREALAVARQIADAIGAAHRKQIVHRDLKPSNVVLQGWSGATSGDPRVRILDFGIAKLDVEQAPDSDLATVADKTRPGRVLGTRFYMSPEQARGEPVDKRTDIWSFGCVLFEMLAARRPFGNKGIVDTVAAILEQEPDWSALPGDTPQFVRTLLRRCLRKDPDKRLHDILDARIEIEDADLNPEAPRSDPAKSFGRVTWTVTTLAILSLVALAAIVAQRFREPGPPRELVAFSIGPPPGARFGDRFVRFAASPDGRYLAVVASSTGGPKVWVRPIGALEYRAVDGTNGATFVFWKPDGREIGFFSGGKLKTVRLDAGGAVEVCDAPVGSRFDAGAAWNSDNMIVFMSQSGALQRVSTSGGAPVPVTELQPGDTAHRWPSFLPDGRHFLYLAQQGKASGDLRIASLDDTSTVSLGRFESNALYSDGHLLFLSGGQLMARSFDPSKRRLTGEPFLVGLPTKHLSSAGLGTFSVSSTGLLADHGGGIAAGFRLTWMDRGGTVQRTVSDTGVFLNLDLSPDETRVAAATFGDSLDSDIWILDLARNGDGVRLTTNPADEYDPKWSPDGSQIAFTSYSASVAYGLWRRPSKTGGREELLVSADSVSAPEWSSDGNSILYTGPKGLWIRPLGGDQKPRPFLTRDFETKAASISPDGRWVAYSSNSSGRRYEVYVRSFPSGEDEHKISLDGGFAPRWRGDGKELFFLSPDAAMMAAEVDTTMNGFHAKVPVKLFETSLEQNNYRPYTVSRDGRRFLLPVRVDPSGPDPITVLLNWRAMRSR